ncbi:MAG: hypothetical protein LBF88_10185, partial [Planctomycetaceae bacterium]|nr:hypothetical protein [Planctomycetaceae bacterium]
QEVLDAGMNGHIGKPIDIQIVLDAIRKIIKKHQAIECLPDDQKEKIRNLESGVIERFLPVDYQI